MSAHPSTGHQNAPLPQGWMEHRGPTGQPYYYNYLTRASTYIRPTQSMSTQPVKTKEKPLFKTPIPGTDWLRVMTTDGNIFYSHKVKKESVWVIPEELKTALEALQGQEEQHEEHFVPTPAIVKSPQVGKRKAIDAQPFEELALKKKARVEEGSSEEEEEEEEDEEWQREAVKQLAAEAEEERIRTLEREKEAAIEAQHIREQAIPQKMDLSIEEGKALFKTLLREKDINPLHPWDTVLPKFISDPRYILLPSVTTRREAFDEYCKERAREMRQSTVKMEKEALSPGEQFDRLLKEEVKSTRTSWTDFRRAWKKDRRFYGWGRDDKDREKRFRVFLKELGEQKRAAGQKAESDFFAMLKENISQVQGLSWKEAKKILSKDPRYEAIGSSSFREELFDTFVKGETPQIVRANSFSIADPKTTAANPRDEKDESTSRQERRVRAVKDREEKVTVERRRLDANIERSKQGIDKEEGERTFMTLLLDAVRDANSNWEKALPQLKTDPRFNNSPLPLNQRLHLFHAHISRLRERQIINLRDLFEAHAHSLATAFDRLPLDTILSSTPVTKLGYDIELLEQEFDKWQRERTTAARVAFDEMMSENSFVEFWGRLSKIGGEGVNGGLRMDGEDIGEGGDGDERVDMKALAKTIDIKEMEKVLKNDKRFTVFDHVPEQRERWLRDHLANLAAPRLSVHIN